MVVSWKQMEVIPMRIDEFQSDLAIQTELGKRLKSYRVKYPMTQKELAEKTGVAQRTISNLENGGEITLRNLIKIMRALHLIGNMDVLVPESHPNPNEVWAYGKERERATSKEKREKNRPAGWKWGDE